MPPHDDPARAPSEGGTTAPDAADAQAIIQLGTVLLNALRQNLNSISVAGTGVGLSYDRMLALLLGTLAQASGEVEELYRRHGVTTERLADIAALEAGCREYGRTVVIDATPTPSSRHH